MRIAISDGPTALMGLPGCGAHSQLGAVCLGTSGRAADTEACKVYARPVTEVFRGGGGGPGGVLLRLWQPTHMVHAAWRPGINFRVGGYNFRPVGEVWERAGKQQRVPCGGAIGVQAGGVQQEPLGRQHFQLSEDKHQGRLSWASVLAHSVATPSL